MKISIIIITLLISVFGLIELFKQFKDDFPEYKYKTLFIISLAASFVAGGLVAYYLM
jgi:hypothetical protein